MTSQIIESTRAQDAAAEEMANRFGRSRVEMRPDGRALIVGMTDDIEREFILVAPDGTEENAESLRPGVRHDPAIQPVIARVFTVIDARGYADRLDLHRTAGRLLDALERGQEIRVLARIEGTAQERRLSHAEVDALIAEAGVIVRMRRSG